uniref:Vacuolar iron transporter homolog 4-like n=1 Tax=Tanacetum cinerariifolium TaxID=118510 RepID=A0A6L2JFN3_TANCI|nr:vacuolar iron transporter homolog 4-like [Tanacetum cinerariifolium]
MNYGLEDGKISCARVRVSGGGGVGTAGGGGGCGAGSGVEKEERVRLLVGSPGASTTPIYSPGSSSTPIYSPGSSTAPRYSPGASTSQSYSLRTSRNAECSNCKHLLDKITVLEATVDMYMHPEQHTVNSAALFHEVYTNMGKLNLDSMEGLNAMLENGLYFIRNNPLILKKWHPDVNLLKEDVGTVLVWVKLHGVPVTAFSEDDLSVIATKLVLHLLRSWSIPFISLDIYLDLSNQPSLFFLTFMAANQNDVSVPIPENQSDQNQHKLSAAEDFDYSQRGQWLRAAVLGANDGLVSVVAGACSMAIGEFVSVYSQLDVEVAHRKRENRMVGNQEEEEKEHMPNPMQAAVASALAFTLGAIFPLLAASFIEDHKTRLGMVVAVVSLALVLFGWIGAVLGGTPVAKSCFRVLFGGLTAMAITFGLTKLIGSSAL